MDIAINSKVDGIITYVTDETKYTSLIEKAAENAIPVITMGKEVVDSKKAAYISVPNYKTGVESAKELISMKNKNHDVAIILKGNKGIDEKKQIDEDVIYNGFKNTIKEFSNIKINKIELTYNLLDTNKITRELIKGGKINTIFCTGIDETVVAAQTIVDLNSVGNITLIGVGDNSEILRCIDYGIIKASIINDQYNIGYDSIEQMINIKKGNYTSSYIDVSVSKINKSNLNLFTKDKLLN